MMTKLVIAALAVTAVIAGCGGGGSTSTSELAPSATATQATASRPDPRAQIDRNNYQDAKTVCGAFPVRKVARDLGVRSSDPVTIATAYARGYRPAFRQPVFSGCLAGSV